MKYHYFISVRFYLPLHCIIYLIAFMIHYISRHDPVIFLTDKLVMLLDRILHHFPGRKSTFSERHLHIHRPLFQYAVYTFQ